jgi:hypothetical protein
MINWREDYKKIKKLTKKQIELLDSGPISLASSWSLQVMYNDWKRIKGIKSDNT